MMKKLGTLLLAVVMLMSLAACGGAGDKANTGVAKAEIASCEDLLNQVWDTFAEDEKFAAYGGDFGHLVDGKAGTFDLSDEESLVYSLLIPQANVAMIDEAASLIHMMNANTFTGAAFHVADPANVDGLVDALKENIMNTQWMCGFPDTLNIFVVNGEYVVSTFGNAEIMENFKTKLTAVFGESSVVMVEESLI